MSIKGSKGVRGADGIQGPMGPAGDSGPPGPKVSEKNATCFFYIENIENSASIVNFILTMKITPTVKDINV